MSTANSIELLIITIVLSALFLVIIVLVIETIIVVYKIKKVVDQAERVVHNVSSAADVLSQMGKAAKSRFPLLKLIHSFFNEHEVK